MFEVPYKRAAYWAAALTYGALFVWFAVVAAAESYRANVVCDASMGQMSKADVLTISSMVPKGQFETYSLEVAEAVVLQSEYLSLMGEESNKKEFAKVSVHSALISWPTARFTTADSTGLIIWFGADGCSVASVMPPLHLTKQLFKLIEKTRS